MQRLLLEIIDSADQEESRLRFRRRHVVLATLLIVAVAAAVGLAQRRGRYIHPGDRNGVPEWQNEPEFAKDVFTFVRVRYQSWGAAGPGRPIIRTAI